jgi:hypothetical protein
MYIIFYYTIIIYHKMSQITVKQFLIRIPDSWSYHMTDEEYEDALKTFYAGLGTNLPKYCKYVGGCGGEIIFCVSKDFDARKYCADVGVESYSETLFTTDADKFNSDHMIHPIYIMTPGSQPYGLRKKR